MNAMSNSANLATLPGISSDPRKRSVVDDFMEQYDQVQFQNLADDVKDTLRDIITEFRVNNSLIKYQAFARAKKAKDVRAKLTRENEKHHFEKLDSIWEHNAIWDLAGVRILVYFPDDAASLAWHMIHKQDKLHLVTDPVARHSARELRNVPKERKLQNMGKAELEPYIGGPLADKEKDGFVRLWKHAGYRAVHFYVVTKPEPGQQKDQDATHFQAAVKKDKRQQNDVHAALFQVVTSRDIGQQNVQGAANFQVTVKEDTRQQNDEQTAHYHVVVKRNTRQQNDQRGTVPRQHRVEIQIMSVVMHAWSEVEHDLIYKNPRGLPQDPTLDRILDSINGLAITSETLLQQLQQTRVSLEDEGRKRLVGPDKIQDMVRLWARFQPATWLQNAMIFDRMYNSGTSRFYDIFINLFFDLLAGHNASNCNVKTLRRLLENCSEAVRIQSSRNRRPDIWGLLVIELEKHFTNSLLVTRIPYDGEWSPYHDWLCKLFLVDNVISNEEALGGTSSWPFSDTATLIMIHEILMGEIKGRDIYEAEDHCDNLDKINRFCERYLDSSACPFDRVVAIALARLSYTFVPAYTEVLQPAEVPKAFLRWKSGTDRPLPPMDLSYVSHARWSLGVNSIVREHHLLGYDADPSRFHNKIHLRGRRGGRAGRLQWFSSQSEYKASKRLMAAFVGAGAEDSCGYLQRLDRYAVLNYIDWLGQGRKVREEDPGVEKLTTSLSYYRMLLTSRR